MSYSPLQLFKKKTKKKNIQTHRHGLEHPVFMDTTTSLSICKNILQGFVSLHNTSEIIAYQNTCTTTWECFILNYFKL